MTRWLKGVLATAMAASLLVPPAAVAKPSRAKAVTRIVVHPKYVPKRPSRHRRHDYGFLPGYRQPPNLSDWRDRSVRHRGTYDGPYERRYWYNGQLRYGWGGAGFHRGRWNGGSFGPCWTSTPIGLMWNCGR